MRSSEKSVRAERSLPTQMSTPAPNPAASKTLDARDRDIRDTSHYQSIEDYFRNLHAPAFGKISGAANLAASPNGKQIAFTGSIWHALEDVPSNRICIADVEDGSIETITSGPNNDRLPKWSPDGSSIAFLSDRAKKGVYQLQVLHRNGFGEAVAVQEMKGSAEYFEWSPRGTQILVGMAGLGADANGVSGAKPGESERAAQSWMPTVESGSTDDMWRTVWIYHASLRASRPIKHGKFNIWEATWLGGDRIAAIVSEEPSEESWYGSYTMTIDVETGDNSVLHMAQSAQTELERERPPAPAYQLGGIVSNSTGVDVAVITALCSDRGVVAGGILVINSDTGVTGHFDIDGVDVTQLIWHAPNRLFYVGVRGFESVAGEIVWADDGSHQTDELWSSLDGCGEFYPAATLLSPQVFAYIRKGWTTYPEIVTVQQQDGQAVTRKIHSLAHPGSDQLLSKLGLLQQITWPARDGLEIQGLLTLPRGQTDAPRPLILNIHGGPVYCWQNHWLGNAVTAILVSRGYAVLSPNPRGSSGRGPEYARRVVGDMGGEEVHDHLTGIDMLVREGVADPDRVGVTGASHGGFMASWIITQDPRFKAAVPVAAVNDWHSQHTTSNIGAFDRIFFKTDPYATSGGQYLERSPVMFAGRHPTPVLQVAGSEDRCVPPVEGFQYHTALLEHGVESVLATYPGEGHGIRKFPAYIDFCARVVGWFERFMPA